MPDSLPESSPSQPLDRRIALATAANMRDLGGLSVDGGVFTHGQVFRSASLASLSTDDGRHFTGLGIAMVYDLRTSEERDTQPDRLPESARLVILDVLADARESVAATIGKLRTAPDSMNELLEAGTIQQNAHRVVPRLRAPPLGDGSISRAVHEPRRSASRRRGSLSLHCRKGSYRMGGRRAAYAARRRRAHGPHRLSAD